MRLFKRLALACAGIVGLVMPGLVLNGGTAGAQGYVWSHVCVQAAYNGGSNITVMPAASTRIYEQVLLNNQYYTLGSGSTPVAVTGSDGCAWVSTVTGYTVRMWATNYSRLFQIGARGTKAYNLSTWGTSNIEWGTISMYQCIDYSTTAQQNTNTYPCLPPDVFARM